MHTSVSPPALPLSTVSQSKCLIFNSFRPIRAASYQWISAKWTLRSDKRTRAIPLFCASDRGRRPVLGAQSRGSPSLQRKSRCRKFRPESQTSSDDRVMPHHAVGGIRIRLGASAPRLPDPNPAARGSRALPSPVPRLPPYSAHARPQEADPPVASQSLPPRPAAARPASGGAAQSRPGRAEDARLRRSAAAEIREPGAGKPSARPRVIPGSQPGDRDHRRDRHDRVAEYASRARRSQYPQPAAMDAAPPAAAGEVGRRQAVPRRLGIRA